MTSDVTAPDMLVTMPTRTINQTYTKQVDFSDKYSMVTFSGSIYAATLLLVLA